MVSGHGGDGDLESSGLHDDGSRRGSLDIAGHGGDKGRRKYVMVFSVGGLTEEG